MNTNEATPYIYADNAATTPLSPRALEAMMPYLTGSFGNPSGIHRIARNAAVALGSARATMARLLGAAVPEEIYFTSGGSESDNWILRGSIARFHDLHGADVPARIITSAIEHHAILHCCEMLAREGVEVTYLPVDEFGRIDPRDLKTALARNDAKAARLDRTSNTGGGQSHRGDVGMGTTPATALVSIMLANNEVGTVEPIAELAQIAHAHGAAFHTDAVQAVGHIPVDIQALGIDALSLSGHKFHGPRGVGALYLREGFSIPPLIAGGAQERGERAGTENLAGIVGMVAALEEACEHLAADMTRISTLRDALVGHLTEHVDGIRLTGAPITAGLDGRLPSIASFTCDDVDGELLVVLLDRAGVAAATGSACSTGSTEPSHVLTAMGIDAAAARGALRFSLASNVTAEDIALLSERVPTCIRKARLISSTR